MNTDRHPHSHFAVTRERARKRQEWLRSVLPDSIGQFVELSRSGNILDHPRSRGVYMTLPQSP